jgi:hypothetical protein
MRLRGASLVGTTLGILVAVTLSAVAYAAEQVEPGPLITSVSVSHITKTGATLTAVINPEGTETKYEVELTWKQKCGKRHCEKYRTAGTGTLAGANRVERVSVHLTKLKAHTSYLVSFGATNESGSTRFEDENGFKTK